MWRWGEWAGALGAIVAAIAIWRWIEFPEAGIAVAGFTVFLFAMIGTIDERLITLIREIQELRRELHKNTRSEH